MNVNEVIAGIVNKIGVSLSPNDHVNLCQSSNDVIPTAIQVSAVSAATGVLLPSLKTLGVIIRRFALENRDVIKTGRTHLMDAMPVTFAQELNTWASITETNIKRLRDTLNRVADLPQGGTAVGTGINADPKFGALFAEKLSAETAVPFTSMANKFDGISAQDNIVELSGQLKVIASTMMKVANDLRWMNSGPLAGMGEIELPSLQPGSSIMPGKVNPVIPEAVAMVCAQVYGNDTTVSMAGQSGNFQLNVMLPVIAYNVLQSIHILSTGSKQLAYKAIKDFNVNHAAVSENVGKNPILVTALNAVIGYDLGAKIAKQAYKEKRSVLDVTLENTDLSEAEIKAILDPIKLTTGGIEEK